MKLVKTSAIALAVSAMLAGPVLAQGAASDTQTRGGAQGKTNMQGGAAGSADEDMMRAGAPGEKAGVEARREGHGRHRQRNAKGTGERHRSRDRPKRY